MHVILVATQKGGAGKSTLCAHFGSLADRQGKTLLVDADPQGSLSGWYQSRETASPLLVEADADSIGDVLDAALAEDVEWVIIDSAPHNAPLMASLMSRASVTVVPVRPGPFDLRAAGATLAMARSLKAPIACIINAAPPITRENETSIVAEARAVLTSMGAPVLPGQVSQRASFSHALITGQSVNEYEPDGRAAAEVSAMWSAVTALAKAFPRKD
ncbi:AAA family ATPase [Methylobacterium sp. E-041]|uniref:nucleotide-binding protein n=1 Tax=unclassified Methylobacterium TaxID=2615210 RepID=UPI001FB8804D|nr:MULTISPECIES: AAA family ATPase [unclassified Methylobacterium]MCJ2076581.1 AAA family ATPase [Methylobacterium sp. E-016]MCJ2108553.1 AAA family ATPase [Methylobacterium sp. E-041]MCJ2109996.1 AAA family ATPase [Methylobacterium sp. E-025]